MKQRLHTIRKNAIAARERLSTDVSDQQCFFNQLNRIIRGAVYIKWMHRVAMVFFILFAAFFLAMVYPSTSHMLTILGFAAGGYAVSLLGIFIQMNLYERTIAKVRSLPVLQQEGGCRVKG